MTKRQSKNRRITYHESVNDDVNKQKIQKTQPINVLWQCSLKEFCKKQDLLEETARNGLIMVC